MSPKGLKDTSLLRAGKVIEIILPDDPWELISSIWARIGAPYELSKTILARIRNA